MRTIHLVFEKIANSDEYLKPFEVKYEDFGTLQLSFEQKYGVSG